MAQQPDRWEQRWDLSRDALMEVIKTEQASGDSRAAFLWTAVNAEEVRSE